MYAILLQNKYVYAHIEILSEEQVIGKDYVLRSDLPSEYINLMEDERLIYDEQSDSFIIVPFVKVNPPKSAEQLKIDELESTISVLNAAINQPNPDEIFLSLAVDQVDLDTLKAKKKDQLNYLCNQDIMNGFISNCLGVEHTYPFSIEDQLNMNGAMSGYILNLYTGSIDWKTDDVGILSHTQTQFTQLFADGMTHKQNNISKYWLLKSQVDSSTSKEDVLLINW